MAIARRPLGNVRLAGDHTPALVCYHRNPTQAIDRHAPDRSDRRPPQRAPARRGGRVAPGAPVVDTLGRRLHDLRISVTDRCNFRCVYCMPRDVFGRDYPFLPHDALLTFEEIARVAGVFAGLGVEKIRLTGGEPLLRKHLERLVAMLAPLRSTSRSRPTARCSRARRRRSPTRGSSA
jgi:sulfatase maturation enzyme AslB (radical SAM superfamily)